PRTAIAAKSRPSRPSRRAAASIIPAAAPRAANPAQGKGGKNEPGRRPSTYSARAVGSRDANAESHASGARTTKNAAKRSAAATRVARRGQATAAVPVTRSETPMQLRTSTRMRSHGEPNRPEANIQKRKANA